MTTTQTPDADAVLKSPPTASNLKPVVITLEQLAKDMRVLPRDARMLLRLAAKQTKLYPSLGKEHVARQPWQWTVDSKGLVEARKALAADPHPD